MPNHLFPQLGKDGRIVEGIITTLNADQTVNISPMGPIVDEHFERFTLRPFRTSTTYQNIKRTGQAVFHVTDDIELFVQAALGTPDPLPAMKTARAIEGRILNDACRWYALRVDKLDDSEERTHIEASTIDSGRQREFLGYNRAQHAILEAAILATRLHILPAEEILNELLRLKSPVTKTASSKELATFTFLRKHIESALATSNTLPQ